MNRNLFVLGVATSDSKVKVYDVRAMKLQQQYSAHEGPVNQVPTDLFGVISHCRHLFKLLSCIMRS